MNNLTAASDEKETINSQLTVASAPNHTKDLDSLMETAHKLQVKGRLSKANPPITTTSETDQTENVNAAETAKDEASIGECMAPSPPAVVKTSIASGASMTLEVYDTATETEDQDDVKLNDDDDYAEQQIRKVTKILCSDRIIKYFAKDAEYHLCLVKMVNEVGKRVSEYVEHNAKEN